MSTTQWIFDPKEGQHYYEWTDQYGKTHREWQNATESQGQVGHASNAILHDDSSYRPTSSSSKGRTRRGSVTNRSGKDPLRKNERYTGSESKKGSSQSHDTGGFGSSPQQYDYHDTTSGHDTSRLHSDSTAGHTSTEENITGRMRSMSISDATAYTTDAPPQTNLHTPQKDRYVASTPGQVEHLDERYQVRNHDYKKFFRVGRVFQTLWTEAFSDTTGGNETFVSYVVFNQKVYSKIRRFVVVREGDKCCTCLPVTSYDGRGHKKKGIKLSEHSFIYSQNKPKDVDGIEKRPLKVILSKGAEKLNERSLVNYGRVYTVEKNVKVRDVGDLEHESRKVLRNYFQEVFLPDDDPPGPVTNMTPEVRATDFAGMGAGVSNPTYGQYAPPHSPSAYTTVNTYPPSSGPIGHAPNTYYPTVSTPFTTPYHGTSSNTPGYYSTKSENTAYPSYSSPVITQGSSSSSNPYKMGSGQYTNTQYQRDEAQGADPTSDVPYGTPRVAEYSNATTSVPRSHRSDIEYHPTADYSRSHPQTETIDEEEIVLPTAQEVRESRHHRDNTTSSSKHGRHRRR